MKRWIAGAVFAVGLTVLGGAAVAQDAAPRDEGQRPDTQREKVHTGEHEGCRFGEGNLGNDI
ncbi:MAG: hypothetical protein M3533_15570 [Actinomycetota bacterium]|jgi:hypothetical protein|nr:hypothetical protein [Actinomycetota bacterium]MDQ3378293.1 hypothetical protein [Actinomycetota bacterium]